MTALVIAEGVVVLLLVLLVTGLLRSHAEILRALHELGAGVDPDGDDAHRRPARRTQPVTGTRSLGDAHDITGADLAGDSVGIAVRDVRHDTVLAFLSTGCSTCEPFWSAFRDGVELPAGARLVVVVQDEESESQLRRLATDRLDIVKSNVAWSDYDVPGSPHIVYVDGRTGRVTGEGTGPDWPSVRALLTQAAADRRVSETGAGRSREPVDVDWHDNPTRIDAELLGAGIGPGHPSLIAPPEAETR